MARSKLNPIDEIFDYFTKFLIILFIGICIIGLVTIFRSGQVISGGVITIFSAGINVIMSTLQIPFKLDAGSALIFVMFFLVAFSSYFIQIGARTYRILAFIFTNASMFYLLDLIFHWGI